MDRIQKTFNPDPELELEFERENKMGQENSDILKKPGKEFKSEKSTTYSIELRRIVKKGSKQSPLTRVKKGSKQSPLTNVAHLAYATNATEYWNKY